MKRGATLSAGRSRRAFRVRLEPTVEQRGELSRCVGVARAAYNWALAEWRRQYRAHKLAEKAPERTKALLTRWGSRWALDQRWEWRLHMREYERAKRARRLLKHWQSRHVDDPRFFVVHPNPTPNGYAIHKQLTAIKQEEFPWMTEVPALVVREAVGDVGVAYEHFFRRLKEGAVGRAAGEPRFRSRHARRSFHIDQGSALKVELDGIVLPKFGKVKIHKRQRRYIPGNVKLCGLGISEHLGHWYAAVRAEVDTPSPRKKRIPEKRVGVEVGVRTLAFMSDGKRVGSLRDLEKTKSAERRLALWSRRMSRRFVPGKKAQSQGWLEAKRNVQRVHAEIARTRDELLHYTSRRIVDSGASTVIMREPAVKTMIGRAGKKGDAARARNVLAPMVSKVGWYELRRKTEYKQAWAGGTFVEVPAAVETTRTCSVCGHVRDSDPGYPLFRCPNCAHQEDRESNSAKVLRDYRPAPSGSGPVAGERTARSKAARKRGTTAERTGKPGDEQSASTGSDGDETSPPGSGNGASTQVDGKRGRKPDATRPGGEPSARFRFFLLEQRGDAPSDHVQDPALASPPDGPRGDRSQSAPQVGEIARRPT